MDPYYFLFVLGGVWIAFATVQDLRTREVANWLTFSLIAFTLTYRALYAVGSGEEGFFWWGVVGCGVFVGLAYACYYGRVFAGGDAKLLMGVGVVLPYATMWELVLYGCVFFFLLFSVGAAYTLVYSVFLVVPRWRAFRGAFWKELRGALPLFGVSLVLSGALWFTSTSVLYRGWSTTLLLSIPALFAYVRTVDAVCMKQFVSPRALQVGDWLVHSIRVGKKTIAVNVHGLQPEEIRLLRTKKKSVLIKQGIPFVPAFFIAYGVMVFFFVTGRFDWAAAVSFVLSAF